jgi:hypothetical protein
VIYCKGNFWQKLSAVELIIVFETVYCLGLGRFSNSTREPRNWSRRGGSKLESVVQA